MCIWKDLKPLQGIYCAHHSQKTQNCVGELSQICGLLPKSARVSWLPSQTSSGLSYLRDSGHFLEEIERVGEISYLKQL